MVAAADHGNAVFGWAASSADHYCGSDGVTGDGSGGGGNCSDSTDSDSSSSTDCCCCFPRSSAGTDLAFAEDVGASSTGYRT